MYQIRQYLWVLVQPGFETGKEGVRRGGEVGRDGDFGGRVGIVGMGMGMGMSYRTIETGGEVGISVGV